MFPKKRRDYSLHQRAAGKDAGDTMRIKFLKSNAESFLLIGYLNRQIEMKKNELDRNPVKLNLAKNCILLSCLLLKESPDMNIPCLLHVDIIPKIIVDYDSFTDQYFNEHIGWSRHDVKILSAHLHVPDFFFPQRRETSFQDIWRTCISLLFISHEEYKCPNVTG